MHPIVVSQESHPPCFVSFPFVSFRFNLVFNGVFLLRSQIILLHKGGSREGGNAISKVFQDLDFWTSLRCWRRFFEGEYFFLVVDFDKPWMKKKIPFCLDLRFIHRGENFIDR